MKLDSINALEMKAKQLRKEMLQMYGKAGVGHITSGFSCMELLVALYYADILKYDAGNPDWEERDHFMMSKGHGSTALYPILADIGFFPKEELEQCTREAGMLGICLNGHVPGVEITAGSLAIGFGMAAGLAKAKKLNREKSLTFVMLGDAECYEGAIWETAMFASHNRLNNLIAIVDRNYLACTDFTENMLEMEPFADKWRAFGWKVREINGHCMKQILDAFADVRSFPQSVPLVIIANTVKGKGVSFIENIPLMHGEAVKGEKIDLAIAELEAGGVR